MKTTWILAAATATCLWALRTQVVAADSTPTDQDFLRQADQIDLTEVKLGKIAQHDAAATVVKDFGERMVRDHSRMNQDLQAIAPRRM